MLIFEGVTWNVKGKNLREFGISDTFCLQYMNCSFQRRRFTTNWRKKRASVESQQGTLLQDFTNCNLELWIIPTWIDPARPTNRKEFAQQKRVGMRKETIIDVIMLLSSNSSYSSVHVLTIPEPQAKGLEKFHFLGFVLTRWWLNHPFEKYDWKWESSPGRGENKQYFKPPPS